MSGELLRIDVLVQVLVDLSNSREVFSALKDSLESFLKAHVTEYTGASLITTNWAQDPLKITLCAFWEYSHCGETLLLLADGSLYMSKTAERIHMHCTEVENCILRCGSP